MNGISRTIAFLLVGCAMLSFSCTAASVVSFESENFERFKVNAILTDESPDTFYYARVTTAVRVALIFRKFSKENDFPETLFQNISIFDDKGTVLYKKERVSLSPNGIVHSENGRNYEIYSYEIEKSECNPNILENHKTEYIILAFEIDGKKYSEKLKRVEKKYLVTRT